MKKYTKPIVVKVALNPEQAILGGCMSGISSSRRGNPVFCRTNCKLGSNSRRSDSGSPS